MTEQELRSLVRAAIARQQGTSGVESVQAPTAGFRLHASHAQFMLQADPQAEGRCVIEPAAMCNHCGYCKSWGH